MPAATLDFTEAQQSFELERPYNQCLPKMYLSSSNIWRDSLL